MSDSLDPSEYVKENRETLRDVIRYSDDDFTRALAIVALVNYGSEPDVDQVKQELERAEEEIRR